MSKESIFLCRGCLSRYINCRRSFATGSVKSIRFQDDETPMPKAVGSHHKERDMFWEDSRRIYGQQLPVKRIPVQQTGFDPSKGRLTYTERQYMNATAKRTFDEHSGQLYGPRLQKVPGFMLLESDPIPGGRLMPVEYAVKNMGSVEEDPAIVPSVEDPSGSMDVVAGAAPTSEIFPAVQEAVEVVKPKPVRFVREDDQQDTRTEKEDWRTAEPYIDEEKILHMGKQQWRDPRSSFAENRTIDPWMKPKKGTSKQSSATEKPKLAPSKSASTPSFRIVLLKKESDLKSLTQSPLLNKLRPDFEAVSDGLSLVTPMALQISPVDLTTLDLMPDRYPSVTTIMDTTMSPESRMRLDRWMQNKIEELGLEGFKAYKQSIFANGKGLHTAVEQVLHGASPKSVKIAAANEGHWKSLEGVFKDISDVVAIEEKICHPHLCYKGQTDCVISLQGEPAVVEWKTSGTKKNTPDALYDNPLQVAAYVGAVNFDPYFDEKKTQIKHGAVVVSYGNGDPASVIRFDLNLMQKYWALWLRRLQQYWRMAAAERALPQRKKDFELPENETDGKS